MRFSASPFVLRVWLPILFLLGLYLFFHGTAPQYWLLALPPLLLIIFMITLAEIHDEGRRIRVKTLWKSMDVPREEVVSTAQSGFDGIGVLRLHRFVLPRGRIYFVSDWSKLGVVNADDQGSIDEPNPYGFVRSALESIAMAVSRFLAASDNAIERSAFPN
jgi:hypothetical protein